MWNVSFILQHSLVFIIIIIKVNKLWCGEFYRQILSLIHSSSPNTTYERKSCFFLLLWIKIDVFALVTHKHTNIQIKERDNNQLANYANLNCWIFSLLIDRLTTTTKALLVRFTHTIFEVTRTFKKFYWIS